VGAGPHTSVFQQEFDVVVLGTGFAGYAAAVEFRRRGLEVLLVGQRGDLLWEAGRAFCPDPGVCAHPEWSALAGAVAERGAAINGWMDGAVTEVVATHRLRVQGIDALYYARPVAVELNEREVLTSLLLATKAGLRRVTSSRWVDATESGELLRLLDPGFTKREAARTCAYVALQHADWPSLPEVEGLIPTAWATERILSVDVEPGDFRWRDRVVAALDELAGVVGPSAADVSMSHLSFEPLSRYDRGSSGMSRARNVASAVPGHAEGSAADLAERFMLGTDAVEDLLSREAPVAAATNSAALPMITPVATLRAGVCVAGVGTGGALAAMAASDAGADLIGFEASTQVGGVSTGGGIHSYWFGVPGGLQKQVDLRTRELMKRFGGGPLGDGPFNPWAKTIALHQMLHERGVEVHTDAMLFGVERGDSQVTAVLVATSRGVVRIEADAFIDCTGDGDLCAMAGAEFVLGRPTDGIVHAYSQSSGRLRDKGGRPRMDLVNFDAGYCDPTDPEDLTRARTAGVEQYLRDAYTNTTRPTYIAPILGARQSRQFVTEYVLTLHDQISRRRFEDAIGYTGAHFDTHSTDLEFESAEALFWIWLNRQVIHPLVCEMSYGMLLPRGLDNVWIASRSFGVSLDAHYSCRQQRDIQRAGEAAGFAAALASRLGVTSRRVPYDRLRALLEGTGALGNGPRKLRSGFSWPGDSEIPLLELGVSDAMPSAAAALRQLDEGQPGEAVWWLYRHREIVREAVLERLSSKGPRAKMVSWLAAGILAMWNDPAAEPRLLEAVETLEFGYGEGYEFSPTPVRRQTGEILEEFSSSTMLDPFAWSHLVPNWLCALALLRHCGTSGCLSAIAHLVAMSPRHGVNTLTTAALTIGGLADRGAIDGDAERTRAMAVLDAVLTVRPAGTVDYPARSVGRHSESAVRGNRSDDVESDAQLGVDDSYLLARVDNTWQLHLAVAQARRALGLGPHDAARSYLDDERAYVRAAFAVCCQG
jgi:hypothetical protein